MSPIRLDEPSEMPSTIGGGQITVSEYIFRRLCQVGIKSLFGVPGDFNLALLEHIYDVPELNWIGCCNELNAAYAADAYAKTSKQMAAVVTTFGVGELSALNGIAGAYSEFAPVLHIVGTTALAEKRSPNAKNIHHLIANRKIYQKPDHYVYEKIAKNFSIATASVDDDMEASCEDIDHVIEAIWRNSRPGYIFLPCDLTERVVPEERLEIALDLSYEVGCSSEKIEQVCNRIIERIYSSQNVSVLAGAFISKFRMNKLFDRLVELLEDKVNFFDTYMSKGVYNEEMPRYIGTYFGEKGNKVVSEAIEASDLVLCFGSFSNDMNTGFFSFKLGDDQIADINAQYTHFGGQMDTDVTMMDLLPVLVAKLDVSRVNTAVKYTNIPRQSLRNVHADVDAPLTEADVGRNIENLLQPHDVLIIETCSFMTGAYRLKMNGACLVNQCFWGSIGYALPATLGASLALRDFQKPGKVVTVEGDGSAQMSLPELVSMLRYNVSAIMLMLNNDGYTIERALNGPYRSYNDICGNWQWTQMLKTFGDINEEKSKSYKIDTAKQLYALTSTAEFHNEKRFQMVELIVPKFDMPWNYKQYEVKELSS
ncbi:DEKNAAC100698 [Brettanomyces naardenensis]|uniref:DEKNAAC100698 n=1 Tax=Brettanomyces naardenensis TaxID=13370 RepID=A0A448YG14_BRENA|nr:DEKNAAC100698 [Brettanomyces naardenensis]